MEPTELSEVEDLEKISDDAIAQAQPLVLAQLNMVPWTRKLQYSQTYPMKPVTHMQHFGYVMEEILPPIVRAVPSDIEWDVDLALSEVLKGAYEEGAKVDATEIRTEHSELGVIPVEFVVYSSLREISPMFAKYWRHQKQVWNERGLCDIDTDYYQFSGEEPTFGQTKHGRGLINMLNNSVNCGFYKAEDDTLLTHIAFAKRR
jgi:hypothetical protein